MAGFSSEKPMMTISAVHAASPTAFESLKDNVKHITRRIDQYLDRHEAGFQRMARVRKAIIETPENVHHFDRCLNTPEQYKSAFIRGLIHVGNALEELGDACADISGLAERLVRNTISSGEKSDLAMVIASAAGRIVSGQLNLFGIGVHKVAGTAFYALSTLVSAGTIGLCKTPLGRRRSPQELQAALHKCKLRHGIYRPVARQLLQGKHAVLNTVVDKTSDAKLAGKQSLVKEWSKRLMRGERTNCAASAFNRKYNTNYMWQNVHQYGPVTRALMQTGCFVFLGLNKTLVSFDKHVATAVGEKVLAKKAGSILGCRIGYTVSVAGAAALSVPMSPLIVGLSTAGAIACGFALTAMLLAKANAYCFNDWKGNIAAR